MTSQRYLEVTPKVNRSEVRNWVHVFPASVRNCISAGVRSSVMLLSWCFTHPPTFRFRGWTRLGGLGLGRGPGGPVCGRRGLCWLRLGVCDPRAGAGGGAGVWLGLRLHNCVVFVNPQLHFFFFFFPPRPPPGGGGKALRGGQHPATGDEAFSKRVRTADQLSRGYTHRDDRDTVRRCIPRLCTAIHVL